MVKAEEPVEPTDYDALYTEACANTTRDNPGVNCTYDQGKLSVSKKIYPDGEIYIFKKDDGLFETVYNVKLTGMPEVTNATDLTGGMGSSSTLMGNKNTSKFKDGLGSPLMSAATLKSVMKLTYTIHMPAKIENASVPGTVSDDGMSVAYDVLDLYDEKKDIEITSREEHTLVKYLALGGGVVLVLIICGAAALWLRGRGKAA